MANLDSILQQKHRFTDQVPQGQSYGFTTVMNGCEGWTLKKAECQRIDSFELWCWGRLLKVPWTAKEIKPVKPKENKPEYSLEELILKLKLQYSSPPDVKSRLIGKDLDAGKN